MAELHPRLAGDCLLLGQMPLSRLLLMNDSRYPWFILVPDREGISEIHELAWDDQQQLLTESMTLSRAMSAAFRPDKLNIAALGNVVPQLHVHHVARYRNDPVWPAPVWGALPAKAYQAGQRAGVIASLRTHLGDGIRWVG